MHVDQVLWLTGLLHHDTHVDLSLYFAVHAKFSKTFGWLELFHLWFCCRGAAGGRMVWGEVVMGRFFQVMNFS